MLLCGGYGVVNMIGFASTNRVAVAEANTASNNADERQYQMALAAKKADIDWTRGTVIREENPREKKRLEAALTRKEKELADLKPPKPSAATVLADPQATLFSKLIGWSVESWQMTLPIPVAFLLYLAEAFSFIFAMQLLIGAVADWRTSCRAIQPTPATHRAMQPTPAEVRAPGRGVAAKATGSASVPRGDTTDADVPPGYATDAGITPAPPGVGRPAGEEVAQGIGSAGVPPGYATDASMAPVAKTPAANGHNNPPDRRLLSGLPHAFSDASKQKATRDQRTQLLLQDRSKSDAALARETGWPRETIRDMRRRKK
jgi:hypothetical protein